MTYLPTISLMKFITDPARNTEKLTPAKQQHKNITRYQTRYAEISAHLWGAYAIPLALSVVYRLSSVARKLPEIHI